MGKYDKYKKLVFPASLVKTSVTTSVLNNPGTITAGGQGNEGIDLAEWLQEKIDDGTIVISGGTGNTDLSADQDSTTVTIFSSTGTDATITAASTLRSGVMSAQDKLNLESLITLTGVSQASTNLGIFSGSIIPDNTTIKIALQALETTVDSITGATPINPSDIITITPVIGVVNGTNTVLDHDVSLDFYPDQVDLSTLGGKLQLSQLDNTSATFGQFIVFNGTDWAATDYTPSTGSGVANQVTYWAAPTMLTGNNKFLYDGNNLTLGTGTQATNTRFTIKGVGTTNTTYGITHRNSSSVDVFKVADNGALTIGSSGEVYIHSTTTAITNGGQYNIDKSGGDLKLTSDTQVVVESGGTASNTPSLKVISTRSTNIGNLYTAQIEGTFNIGSGTNPYTDLYVSTIVNQTGGTNPIRSVYINPSIIAAQPNSLRGLEINVPGHTALKTTAGYVSFTLGSDATGDIFYRDANGNLARLPVGTASQVLGSTGTTPTWITTSGSLPAGSSGDFLIYSSGSWVAASQLREKQTGLTGTSMTLASSPLASTPIQIYKNGQLIEDTDDYTIAGATVTFVATLSSSDKITAIYYI